MPKLSPPRIEWISVLYLALFVLAVLTPRIVQRSVFGFEEVQIEEALIFAFGITGLLTFSVYGKLVERRERERSEAYAERDRAKKELSSSYAYIGAINRQMDALKRVANDTAASVLDHDGTHKKELFQSLAASAAAFLRAPHATVRIVDVGRIRTVREYHAVADHPVQAPNKHLITLHTDSRSHGFVRGDAGDVLVIPSDHKGADVTKAFILIPVNRAAMPEELDGGILSVYANQAELLHHSTPSTGEEGALSTSPMALIRAAEEQVVGEVS
jgi:hypothetical protein